MFVSCFDFILKMIMHAKCQKDNYSSSLTKRFIYFHHVVLLFLLNYGINCTSVFVCINSVADSVEVRHIYRNTSSGRLLMTSLGNFPFPWSIDLSMSSSQYRKRGRIHQNKRVRSRWKGTWNYASIRRWEQRTYVCWIEIKIRSIQIITDSQ